MLQVSTKDPYEEGHSDGHRRGYDEGYDDGYDAGKADAERSAVTEEDLYPVILDEVLDRLARHFDPNQPAVAAALREVLYDYNHPSRIGDWSKVKIKTAEAANA